MKNGHTLHEVEQEMQLSILNKGKFASIVGTTFLLVTSAVADDRCRVVTVTETESVAEIQAYDGLNRSVNRTNDGAVQCSVFFNALINGQYYPSSATVTEYADSTYVCNQAFQSAADSVRKRAAGERLITKQHMVCDDNNNYQPRTGFRPDFQYKGFTCKYFQQTVEQGGKLYSINKPACEIGPGQWVGIENW